MELERIDLDQQELWRCSALTLMYFLNKNLAVELFCCFAKHEIDGKGAIARLGEIADTWIFPPALTLQYHFAGMGAWKPYVGAGVQYINFFDTGTGANLLGATKVDIDDAWGLTLQAGLDVSLGDGWSLNADFKKTLLDTAVTWHNNTSLGGRNVVGDVDLDPCLRRPRLPIQSLRLPRRGRQSEIRAPVPRRYKASLGGPLY